MRPTKAQEIIAKPAEFAAPKLTRAEVATEGNHQARNAHIQIEFVNAPPRDQQAPARALLPPLRRWRRLQARNCDPSA